MSCLVPLFDRKLQVLKNLPKWTIFGIFNLLLSTQNVNVARFARNVEWDFFCDFQTPCSNENFLVIFKDCLNYFRVFSRDNGIVIETSKLQLALEIIFSLSVHTAYFVVPRKYFVFDRFISLTIFIVPFVVQPLFFFVGDLRFRTRVQNRGLMTAIKMEILDL